MNYEQNIKNYYLYSAFSDLLIIGPILVLYLTTKGLSFTEIMLLQSISSIAVVIFEVPTGAVADKIGRKFSVLLGCILWAVSLLIYALGRGFLLFVGAEIIFSLGSAFKSGADSALIYDSLKSIHQEDMYQRVEGKARSITLYTMAFGSLVSSFVYDINISLPFIISVAFMIISALITLRFKEPPIGEQIDNSPVSYFAQIKESGLYILQNKKLKAIVLYCMAFFIFYRAGFWFYQPYMEAVKIPVKYFGAIFLIFNLAAAFISKRSHRIMDMTKPRTLTFLSLLMIVSFLVLGLVHLPFGVAIILLQQAARGLYFPVTSKYLNKHIPSDKRATVLSFQSLSCNLAVTLTFPFMGMLKDNTNIFTTHIILTLVMTALMIVVTRYMNKHLGTNFKNKALNAEL